MTPEPRKRPRSSWIRFEAAAPNELWPSDVTHWRLADGTEVEIISWLDDHSRYLLGCTAFERFHQTLKRWLGRQPAARTLAELQAQLDGFRLDYNEQRPHRATGRMTPAEAYRANPKAQAAGTRAAGHFRRRYDVADRKGAMTLRRAGRLHHLNLGAAFARRRVLAIVDELEVTVVALDTGEILSTHLIEPARRYPGQRPSDTSRTKAARPRRTFGRSSHEGQPESDHEGQCEPHDAGARGRSLVARTHAHTVPARARRGADSRDAAPRQDLAIRPPDGERS